MVKLSVLIPNYNHAQYLQQRIDSIICQTFQDFEIIILDDCSTDQSREIIEKYRVHPKVSQILYNEANSGSPFKQWIKGINLAKGKYIWIAESDDWSDTSFLSKILSKLESDPEITLCSCRSFRTTEDGKIEGEHVWADQLDSQKWKHEYINDGNHEITNYLIYRNTIANASACIFKKDAVVNYNFLNRFYYCGDWLLWVKLIENKKIAFVPEKLNYFRRGNNSTTLKKVSIEKEIKRFKEYFFIINYCKKKIKMYWLYPVNKYDWILNECMIKFNLNEKKYLDFVLPPLPLYLLIIFYYRKLKSIIRFK